MIEIVYRVGDDFGDVFVDGVVVFTRAFVDCIDGLRFGLAGGVFLGVLTVRLLSDNVELDGTTLLIAPPLDD